MDNFNRLWRKLKPVYYRILFKLHGFKFYQYGGGIDPPADPPPEDPPPADPPPSDPNANPFFDGLSEENRGVNKDNVATLSKFKSADDLAKSYIELETKVGTKGIIVPDSNATPEVKEKFLNDLGRPEKPEGYKLDAVEGMHESIKITDETTTHFNNEMHKIGLTNAQANQINAMQMKFVNESIVSKEKADKVASDTAETALRADWKGDYDVKVAEVQRLFSKVGGQDLINAFGDKGNDPTVVKAMSVLAGMLSEDQINSIRSPIGQEGGNETPEEAKSKIAELTKSGSESHKALMGENHVDHKKMVAEQTRLFEKAYPKGGN